MKPNFTYSDVPTGFGHCFAKVCKLADTCMRLLTVSLIPANHQTVNFINPALVTPDKGKCAYYLKDQTVQFALGMSHTFDKMEYQKVTSLKHALMGYYGETSYYRCARGARYITPAEQRDIADIFRRHGISEAPVYDKYVDMYPWQNVRLRKK
jgi:hypothetical protein